MSGDRSRLSALQPTFLAAVSGTLLALAFPYSSLWLLAWVALVPLLLALSGRSLRGGAALGYVFGLFLYGITLRWSAELDPQAGPVLWMLFVLIESLVPALLGVVLAGFSRGSAGDPLRPLAIATSWTLMEYLRTKGAYSLTWSEISYSQLPSGFVVQMADVTGALGVGFVVVLVNACIAEVWRWRWEGRSDVPLASPLRMALLAYGSFVLLSLGYGAVRQATLAPSPGEGVGVACLQPNVDPHAKWDPARFTQLMKGLQEGSERAGQHGAWLVIWPETAIPRPVLDDPALLSWVQGLARGSKVNILVGATDRSPDGHYQNTAFLVNPEGQVVGRYDKMHLVPFGEYLPLRGLLGKVPPFDTIHDLVPGSRPLVFKTPRLDFGALICFESTFASLCRDEVAEGAQAIVVITNDGWFNRTSAAEHHLAMSAMRAIEQRMWVVQCGNTGVSAFIDPRGVAHDKTDLFTQAEIYATIWPNGQPTLYQRMGNAFICLVALAWLGCVGRASRRR